MTRFKTLFVLAISSLFIFSCAVDQTSEFSGFTTESFRAWMAKYAPNAELKEESVYVEFLSRASNWEELPAPQEDSSWLKMSYTGYTLQDNIFETRDSTIARMLNTWLYNTHFTDDFVQYVVSSKICDGLFSGLKYMRAGDSARIYIPLELGYTYSMNENIGYAGETSNYLGIPVYFDVKLNEVVNDPFEWELENLNNWAADNWGMTIQDTICKGLYMRIIEANPLGDSISVDTTVNYNYSSYFPDGQLIQTTIESVADSANYYDSSTSYAEKSITPTEFTESDNNTVQYSVFGRTIRNMLTGETAEVIAASWLTEGLYGNTSHLPEILPYQFERLVITVIESEDED